MDKLVEVDAQYREWISEVSKRFHQSQIKAAVKVNDEMLRFYWQLGKELHDRKDKFSYGQSFYKTISRDLRRELPDVKSFSETNLRYMQKFAELYSEVSNLPQLGEDFRSEEIEPLLQFRGDIIRLLLISAMEIRKSIVLCKSSDSK